MALLIRIDVDRPYGRRPLWRHVLSRVSSDLYFPRINGLGFLSELRTMLILLNGAGAPAHVFFRRCTLPSDAILSLLEAGGHQAGLHLENSRSYETFLEEKQIIERHTGKKVKAVSKHGSGGAKFGRHHYAPYEPERYSEWARRASMRLLLGNLENPALNPSESGGGLLIFPSAFWLEPHWRDCKRFTVDWLLEEARKRDIVLLVHPENILADPELTKDFKKLIASVDSRIVA